MDTKDLEIRIKYGKTTYWKDGILVGKRCSSCNEDKEIGEFNFQNKKKGTYHSQCKECDRKRCEKWREDNPRYYKDYYKNNIERERKRVKKWKENNESALNYNQQWKGNNKEKIKEYNKKLKETQYYKKYYENNKERYHVLDKKYRNKRKEKNIKQVELLLSKINPIFKQLNLTIYGVIYKVTHINGHCYIGQTTQPLDRRYGADIIKGWIKERFIRNNQKFLEEMEEEKLTLEIIDVGFCKWHLDKLESLYINKFNSWENGYNNNAGNFKTDDGLEEFEQILKENELEFINNKIIKKRSHK